ncbi:MAG: phosphoribosylformylglycinamidine cyclo-ligase [Desulfobacterales bacterium]
MPEGITYAEAGVDIDRGNRLVDRIKAIAKETARPGVMSEIGGFGGLFSLNVEKLESPVLVSSTDGVGTKLKIAFMTGRHDTVGIDLVAMCVNDICVQGAKPLFFLDYLATGRLDEAVAEAVIRGIGEGCLQARCALIGGETAEMPGMYQEGEYDLAGFAVGIVDNEKIIDGSEVRQGDVLIGVASNGLHSNGYSLVRKICFEVLGLTVDSYVEELGKTLGEELLTPTRIYANPIRNLIKDLPIRALAHITGGGLPDNILRVIPESCAVRLFENSWEVPPIFPFLQKAGKVTDREMRRTFNCGVGMIAVVPEAFAQEVLDRLHGMEEKAYVVGDVAAMAEPDRRLIWMVSDENRAC